MFLGKQIQKVDGIVSGFEDQLAKDSTILDQPNALQTRYQQLQVLHFKNKRIYCITDMPEGIFFSFNVVKQVLQKDVVSKKDELNKLGRELDLTEQACSSLQQRFSEFCPDIRRQENEVKNLKNRYTNLNNQLQERWSRKIFAVL